MNFHKLDHLWMVVTRLQSMTLRRNPKFSSNPKEKAFLPHLERDSQWAEKPEMSLQQLKNCPRKNFLAVRYIFILLYFLRIQKWRMVGRPPVGRQNLSGQRTHKRVFWCTLIQISLKSSWIQFFQEKWFSNLEWPCAQNRGSKSIKILIWNSERIWLQISVFRSKGSKSINNE